MKLLLVVAIALSSSLVLAQTSPRKSSTKLPARAKSVTPAKSPSAARAKSVTPAKPTSPAQAAATSAATPANTTEGSTDSALMKILKDKLQVRYFAEFLGPSVHRWDDNQVDVDGYSGESKGRYSRSTDPINMFNQFSFRWKIAPTTRAIWDARFTTQFGDRNEIATDKDRQVIVQEDQRLGLNWGYWTSADSVWSTSILPRVRLPTSELSQDQNIILQSDILHILSFQATASLNLSLWTVLRHYWFEQKVDEERTRLYNSPSLTYTFNDTFQLYVQYEHELQHRGPEGQRALNHMNQSLQDVYLGMNVNFTPSFTLMPFIRFAQLQRWGWEDQRQTMQVGAWIMGAIF